MSGHDGHAPVKIGADIAKQLDVIPKQVRVLQYYRTKHAEAWRCTMAMSLASRSLCS